MSRYLFKQVSNPSNKRSLRIGNCGTARVYSTRWTSHTIDGIEYHAASGYWGNDGQSFLFNGFTWTSGDGQNDQQWMSENLKFDVTATGTEGGGKRPNVGINDVICKNQAFANIGFGQNYGSDQTFTLGLVAFAGTLETQHGVFFTWLRSDQPNDLIPRNSQYIFLNDAFFEQAEREDPYDNKNTENADGTPEGGYIDGESNIGDVTAGALPTHPISSSMGIHVYRLDGSNLATFVGKMWGAGGGTIFDDLWSKWKNYKFNPMAGIISCHALPSEFMPTGIAAVGVAIAGTAISGVKGQSVGGQIIEQRYTANMQEYFRWGNFLDYTHAKFIAHIPFCGECEIPAVNCVGGSVLFIYRCDIMTGNVACWVCPTDYRGNTQQIACLTGNCAYVVPVTGNDNGMGEIIGAVKASASAAINYAAPEITAAKLAGDVITSRQNTSTVGNLAGSVALIANNHLFIDVKFANPSYPAYMMGVRGTPSDIGGTVGTFSGHYVEFSDVHADDIGGATEEEKREIEQLLKSGVVV